jgi:hypothetical protein
VLLRVQCKSYEYDEHRNEPDRVHRSSSEACGDHADDEHGGALREAEWPAERSAGCEDVAEERARRDLPVIAFHCKVPARDERQVEEPCDAAGNKGGPRRASEARCEREHGQPEDAPRLEAGRQADDERSPQSPSAPRLDGSHDPEQGQETVGGMSRVEDVRSEPGRHRGDPGEREQPRALHAGGPCGSHHEHRRRRGEQHRKRARPAAGGAVENELERPHPGQRMRGSSSPRGAPDPPSRTSTCRRPRCGRRARARPQRRPGRPRGEVACSHGSIGIRRRDLYYQGLWRNAQRLSSNGLRLRRSSGIPQSINGRIPLQRRHGICENVSGVRTLSQAEF